MTYIISYPRSGNTAFRYLLEFLTKKPTDGMCGAPRNPQDNLQKPLLYKGATDFVAHKRHDFKGVKPEDFVIFIMRDPLEAVIRHNEHRGLNCPNMTAWLDSWFALTKQALEHPNRMVIHYDQLIKVADRTSHKIYRDPQSDGPDFHKNKLTPELRRNSRRYVAEKWKELHDLGLSC